MQQMSIIKNLRARSTYIHIPKWIDKGKRIIIQREKTASNSEQGKGKHESA
jgi:hypothetical protein